MTVLKYEKAFFMHVLVVLMHTPVLQSQNLHLEAIEMMGFTTDLRKRCSFLHLK